VRRTEALVESGQGGRGSLIFGNNLPNFDQRSVFGKTCPPLHSELKRFGEFRGSFIPRESKSRDIGSRGFSGNGDLRGAATSAAVTSLKFAEEC
jgi:hypothetical protein